MNSQYLRTMTLSIIIMLGGIASSANAQEEKAPDTRCELGCVTLLGSNEKVSITEVQKSWGVIYDVNVLDEALTITAFGVTNIDNAEYYTNNRVESWSDQYLSEIEWNEGFGFTYLGNQVSTNDLGVFEDLFGLTENHVAFFYKNELSNSGVVNFNNPGIGFYLNLAGVFSELAAFNGTNVVSQSATNDVPEPTTLAVFVLGLMGLVSRRFKK
jgi:hypothetical protein